MHTPALRPLRAPLAVLLIALLVLTALPTPAHAAAWKLSRLGPVDGQLRGMGVAGNQLVYMANYEQEARFDLYSKPVNGGARVRLNSGLPEGQVEISAADGLHRCSIAGGAIGLVGADFEIHPLGITFTPDGQRSLFVSGNFGKWWATSGSLFHC